MPRWFRVLGLWLPVAVAVSAACGITYLGVQQSYRSNLNDPQVQLAEDGAARLDAGATPASVAGSPTVDIRESLAPFVLVFGADDSPIASSATLDNTSPSPPSGVLDAARKAGVNKVTWQPERGVRIASVSVAVKDGRVVLAGRNMREVEARIDRFGQLALLAWFAALVGTLLTGLLVERAAARLKRTEVA